MIVSFTGGGTWRSERGDSPTRPAFIAEMQANGYRVSNFVLTHTSWLGWGYTFSFDLDSFDPQADETNLRSYFNYYFADLQFTRHGGGTISVPGISQTLQNLFGGGSGGSGGSGSGGSCSYTVRNGDTFNRIAAQFGITATVLHSMNPQVTNINVIRVGQVLTVCGGGSSSGSGGSGGGSVVPNVIVGAPQQVSNTQPPPTILPDNRNWFDKTFFDGAGALTGTAIGVLIVVGAVVVIKVGK